MGELIIPGKGEVINAIKEMGGNIGYHPVFFNILTKAIKKYNDWKTVVEIGVDRGESAYAMLKDNPTAKYYGYDNWFGAWKIAQPYHKDMAEKVLKEFDVTLNQISSRNMKEIPYADLIHVDADHTFEGCLNDLNLVENFLNPKGVIIVHDMIYITVNRAVMFWYEQHKEEFNITIFEHSNRWAIIWRKNKEELK